MAIVRVSDSGINGGKFRSSGTDRDGYALIDEAGSTNASWSLLTNPLGDGKNFRVGYWATSGSVVITESGTVDIMLVNGGRAGTNGPPGFCGGGGTGGPICRTRRLYLNAGTYAVTVGAGGAAPGGAGGNSRIEGPALQENWTYFQSFNGNTSMQSNGVSSIYWDHNGGNPGAGGNPGGGGPGGGGQGGPGVNASGGPAKSISGWTPSPISLGQGGPSSPGFIPVANSADGGGAGCPGGARNGGSGRVYIRYLFA